MRTTTAALAAALWAATALTALGADSTKCHIGDAALCMGEPGCHWDVNRRGCYEGELPAQDACAAHESESVCAISSLGCKWNAEEKKCASQAR